MTYALLLLLVFAWLPLQAMEVDIQAEKTWWQYREYAKDAVLTAIQASFLPSKVQGDGIQVQLSFSSNREEDWFFALSGAWMSSITKAAEQWNTIQHNDIAIQQWDIRCDAQYAVMRHARLGVFWAGRRQEQSRENFVVHGLQVDVAGEPIVEDIRSSWLGLSFVGTGGVSQQLEVSIDLAVPLQVEVINPLFATPFGQRSGYRTALGFRWSLPKSEVAISGLSLLFHYQYQELGGEHQTNGSFWPYNRWQMLGFGVLYAW